MSRLADITIKSLLSSGFALGLAVLSMMSSVAKASDWGYNGNINGIDGLDSSNVTALMTFKVSAATNPWNDNSFDINASYTGVGYNSESKRIGYTEYSTDFNLSGAAHALDFRDAIRERCELSPQKMLDKMIINGGVGFNLNW